MINGQGKLDSKETAHALDVPGLARELHVQLERYIEAQYPIRHASVVAERHALLETTKVISQEPFIESTPGYASGPLYSSLALPSPITAALEDLASWEQTVIPSRLYKHQADALEAFLGRDDDLVVVTGTGSGKTETFLLPILMRSLEEARLRPRAFGMSAMRALILYPMNALVNDQLKRLRALFGDPRLASWLRQRYGTRRPVRFGMYTSRTPYPGMMSGEKNSKQLLPLLDYYLTLAQEQPEQTQELKARGRWPELDLETLRMAILAGKIHVGDNDYELYPRHQMQLCCPDILITNYSMLEYMLMRPIEQTIFQQTAEWLRQDTANTLLIVLDEAHLYSGVTGAEIALLLRRLQARLGIDRDRVRYILTSASLDTGDEGQRGILDFAATLVGTKRGSGFAIIQGQRVEAPPSSATSYTPEQEATALAKFDLQAFTHRTTNPTAGREAVATLAEDLGWPSPPPYEGLPHYLGQQLLRLQAFRQLWKLTSGHAQAFQNIAHHLFPTLDEQERGLATSALLALAAAATTADERPLLPVRAHLFFRGLPPIYACVNPQCSARRVNDGTPGELGALWLSTRLHCTCGARVYELYGHRNCGAIFLRAFAPNEPADFYWHEPGDIAHSGGGDKRETLLEMISGALPSPKISQVNERLARRHVQAALIQTFFLEYLQDTGRISTRQYGYLTEALGTARTFFTTPESYGLSGFERWLKDMLEGHIPRLAQQIITWLPDMLGSRPRSASQKRDFVRTVADDFVADLRRVGELLFPRQTDKNSGEQDKQFGPSSEELMLLDLLFEHGFLPTYAFPRDVRSFVIEERKQASNGAWRIGIKQRPQQSVDIALSEYVPGRELIVDKETYRVGGIYVDPFPGATDPTALVSFMPGVTCHSGHSRSSRFCTNRGEASGTRAASKRFSRAEWDDDAGKTGASTDGCRRFYACNRR